VASDHKAQEITMSASKRTATTLFQPELQLQLAVQQSAPRKQTPDAAALSCDAAHYERWADALRATTCDDAHSAKALQHWSSHRTAQLNTIALQRAGAKRSH
jgi:hypothetical protein